jgi:uncharacterized OB-fold protein
MTPRPRPLVDPVNQFFWQAGKAGQLQILRCQACGTWLHPPRPICAKCLSEEVAPETVSGTGTVYSVTVNHQPWVPGLKVPYVIARVSLDGVDDVLLTTNIVGERALESRIGDAVRVTFEEQDGLWFPLFTHSR